MTDKYHLYIDDTGNRDPDKLLDALEQRRDEMNCFGLGGVIIREEDRGEILDAHERFCREHNITYPLHSHSIRGGRGNFGWLKMPEKAGIFWPALEEYVLSLPIVTTACIVHRPGYIARYKARYREQLWLLCKTAFSILVERAAKYVAERDGVMEIYFEESGKREDRDILKYMRELKAEGQAFDQKNSQGYGPFKAADFRRVCVGKPYRKTKKNPMIQIADLVLFPMAKGGYQPDYRPYVKLREAGKLLDCRLAADDIPQRGIKYSCFDGL